MRFFKQVKGSSDRDGLPDSVLFSLWKARDIYRFCLSRKGIVKLFIDDFISNDGLLI